MSSRLPSPSRIKRVLVDLDKITQLFTDEDDVALRLDTIEGETQALETLDNYVECILADEALANAARERAQRFERRAEKARSFVRQVMQDKLGVTRLERDFYTASIAFRRDVEITDADALPPDLVRVSPDKIAIGKELRAGREIDGATLGNDRPILTIRTK